MTIPVWARPGARCECVDDVWVNTFDIETTGPFPSKGMRFTVVETAVVLGLAYLRVAEQNVASDWYTVDGFRPLTLDEQDSEIFNEILKGASVQTRREMEPAL